MPPFITSPYRSVDLVSSREILWKFPCTVPISYLLMSHYPGHQFQKHTCHSPHGPPLWPCLLGPRHWGSLEFNLTRAEPTPRRSQSPALFLL